MVIAPDGRVMPCHAADSLPGMQFANVRTRRLADMWGNSEAFERFRGEKWMREACRTCPLQRRQIDCTHACSLVLVGIVASGAG